MFAPAVGRFSRAVALKLCCRDRKSNASPSCLIFLSYSYHERNPGIEPWDFRIYSPIFRSPASGSRSRWDRRPCGEASRRASPLERPSSAASSTRLASRAAWPARRIRRQRRDDGTRTSARTSNCPSGRASRTEAPAAFAAMRMHPRIGKPARDEDIGAARAMICSEAGFDGVGLRRPARLHPCRGSACGSGSSS